jgi:hypothetical protein
VQVQHSPGNASQHVQGASGSPQQPLRRCVVQQHIQRAPCAVLLDQVPVRAREPHPPQRRHIVMCASCNVHLHLLEPAYLLHSHWGVLQAATCQSSGRSSTVSVIVGVEAAAAACKPAEAAQPSPVSGVWMWQLEVLCSWHCKLCLSASHLG